MPLQTFRAQDGVLVPLSGAGDAPPPPAPAPGGTTLMRTVSQNGTTVTFDQDYPVGQYVNGDFYAIGPVVVTAYAPAWDGTRNGAMVNPVFSVTQGYAGNLAGYSEASNKSLSLPLALAPGDAFIPSRTWLPGDPGAPTTVTGSAARPTLRSCMVLNVVSGVQPTDAFRPPYCGTWRPQHLLSQVQWNLLPSLAPVSGQPSWETLNPIGAKVWLDHHQALNGRFGHPTEHMRNYSRDFATDIYTVMLALLTSASQATRRTAMINVIQWGIDSCGVVRSAPGNAEISGPNSGGAAQATPPGLGFTGLGGGHGQGREGAAAFAAHILNSADLKAIVAYSSQYWGESGQMRVATGGTDANGTPLEEFGRSPGQATWSEWGSVRPAVIPGTPSYRTCCTTRASMAGVLSASLIPGMKATWNKPLLFEYTDWYVDVDQKNPDGTSKPARSNSAFFASMWDAYRTQGE